MDIKKEIEEKIKTEYRAGELSEPKCYKCGMTTHEGTWEIVGSDIVHDEIYKEFFCYRCLDPEYQKQYEK